MTGAHEVVERLVDATNQHDLDALVACFSDGYRNETPVHPARGFRGPEQVRRNWEQIFANVTDLRAEVVASAIVGESAWTEWEMTGVRRDGSPHHMRGVIVFTCGGGLITRARFYLEPVDDSPAPVGDAVRQQVLGR
ncbi:MAG TPA: nuclear transport factor 2 family protein [Acidimicrobiales bacterium]|nr:nuclear transport factor 2 family protein [Acidimicrobiales bacterium]